MCKAKPLPCRQGWSTMEGSGCRGTLGTDGGCVLLSDGTKGCAFMSLSCGCTWPAREQRNGGKAELGSIKKTMHLTPLAGDTDNISLLALKMTESCPLPSVFFPWTRFDTWVLDLPQDAETLVLPDFKEPNCPWSWGCDDTQAFSQALPCRAGTHGLHQLWFKISAGC